MGTGPDGRPVRRHVSGLSQSTVTKKVRALEKARDSGTAAGISGKTRLGAYLRDWIDTRATLGSVRPRTIEGYRSDLGRVESTIGHIRLDRLSTRNVEYLFEQMVADGVLASVQHCRRTLTAALNDAVRRGMIDSNPVPLATTPRYAPEPMEPYTVEQLSALLRAAAGTRNAVRWTLAISLGLRRGEVLGLKWPDVDLDAGTLSVRRQLQRLAWRHGCSEPDRCDSPAKCPYRLGGGLRLSEPKSAAGRRTIALSEGLVAELRAHRASQRADRLVAPTWGEGEFVISTALGEPIDPRNDVRIFKALCRTAGVPAKRVHDLRHSAATVMLLADVDLATAGERLGHSRVEMTRRYTHVLVDRQQMAAERVDRLLFGDRGA